MIFSTKTAVGEDTIPPVISNCPDTIEITIQIGMSSMVVSWIEPIATDNSGITPTVTQSHQPGDSFPVGTTQVSYSFTDLTENEATCSFKIAIGNLHSLTLVLGILLRSFDEK